LNFKKGEGRAGGGLPFYNSIYATNESHKEMEHVQRVHKKCPPKYNGVVFEI